MLLLIPCLGGRLEDQVLLDVGLQPLAAFFDTDFLAVLADASVSSAEAASAILALSDQWLAASADAAAMIAAGRLVVLANLHADRPALLGGRPHGPGGRATLRLTPAFGDRRANDRGRLGLAD